MFPFKSISHSDHSLGAIEVAFRAYLQGKQAWVSKGENRKSVLDALELLGGKTKPQSLARGVVLCAVLETHVEDAQGLYDFLLAVIVAEQEVTKNALLTREVQEVLGIIKHTHGLLRVANYTSNVIDPETMRLNRIGGWRGLLQDRVPSSMMGD